MLHVNFVPFDHEMARCMNTKKTYNKLEAKTFLFA